MYNNNASFQKEREKTLQKRGFLVYSRGEKSTNWRDDAGCMRDDAKLGTIFF